MKELLLCIKKEKILLEILYPWDSLYLLSQKKELIASKLDQENCHSTKEVKITKIAAKRARVISTTVFQIGIYMESETLTRCLNIESLAVTLRDKNNHALE